MDECAVEEGIELAIQCAVEEAVSYARFVDVPGLWVGDFEVMIAAVLICAVFQVVVEGEYISYQMAFKYQDICAFSFTSLELFPCLKEIFYRNDILVCMSELLPRSDPPRQILPILERIKHVYILWYGFYQKLPRVHRYTLGERIDFLFIETIEMIACASFSLKNEKLPFLRLSIRKLDTLKILLMVLWETKSLDTNKYAALSVPLDEIGKMLGGWLRGIETKTPAR